MFGESSHTYFRCHIPITPPLPTSTMRSHTAIGRGMCRHISYVWPPIRCCSSNDDCGCVQEVFVLSAPFPPPTPRAGRRLPCTYPHHPARCCVQQVGAVLWHGIQSCSCNKGPNGSMSSPLRRRRVPTGCPLNSTPRRPEELLPSGL